MRKKVMLGIIIATVGFFFLGEKSWAGDAVIADFEEESIIKDCKVIAHGWDKEENRPCPDEDACTKVEINKDMSFVKSGKQSLKITALRAEKTAYFDFFIYNIKAPVVEQQNAFSFWIYNSSTENTSLQIRVGFCNDVTWKQAWTNRKLIKTNTGWNKIVIPLDKFENRKLDWKDCNRLWWYIYTDFSGYLDDLKFVTLGTDL